VLQNIDDYYYYYYYYYYDHHRYTNYRYVSPISSFALKNVENQLIYHFILVNANQQNISFQCSRSLFHFIQAAFTRRKNRENVKVYDRGVCHQGRTSFRGCGNIYETTISSTVMTSLIIINEETADEKTGWNSAWRR